jgi:hypothetical protein
MNVGLKDQFTLRPPDSTKCILTHVLWANTVLLYVMEKEEEEEKKRGNIREDLEKQYF